MRSMFGKSRETRKSETPEIPDLKLPENFAPVPDQKVKTSEPLITKTPPAVTIPPQNVNEIENSQLVNNVEKISRIVSPYFIAIAGLSLYDKNFFIGTILITVGILSLLKVSAKDVAIFLEWLKDFLGLGNDNEIV